MSMITSSNGNIFRVTGHHLCGEFTGDAVTPSFDVFFGLCLNKQWCWLFETPLYPLWRHCKGRIGRFHRHNQDILVENNSLNIWCELVFFTQIHHANLKLINCCIYCFLSCRILSQCLLFNHTSVSYHGLISIPACLCLCDSSTICIYRSRFDHLHVHHHGYSGTPWLLLTVSARTSYRKISWSLEVARFRFRLYQSLSNVTVTSAAALPRCLSNVGAIRS